MLVVATMVVDIRSSCFSIAVVGVVAVVAVVLVVGYC